MPDLHCPRTPPPRCTTTVTALSSLIRFFLGQDQLFAVFFDPDKQLLSFVFMFGLPVHMDQYCGQTISMGFEDIQYGRLTLDGFTLGDCRVTIESGLERLHFRFESLDIDVPGVDCSRAFLTVYDGKNPEVDVKIHGRSSFKRYTSVIAYITLQRTYTCTFRIV